MKSEHRQRITEIRGIIEKQKQDLIKVQDEFDSVLKVAYNEPWWREFIKLISQRRQMLSEQLEAGMFDSRREEERARGQISELKMILSIDGRGNRLQEQDEKDTRKENYNGFEI